jgi:hypothetical protein
MAIDGDSQGGALLLGSLSEMSLESVVDLIERTLKKLGVDPAKTRTQSDAETATWTLQRGSAQVLVNAQVRAGQAFLRVIAPILTLPEPGKRELLYARALELNASGIGNCAFGVVGDRLVAVSERPGEGLGAEEVEQIVKLVAAVADTYDDRFVSEFGGKRASSKS